MSAVLDPDSDPDAYHDHFDQQRVDARHDGSVFDDYMPVATDDLQQYVQDMKPGIMAALQAKYGELPFKGFEAHAVERDSLGDAIARYMSGTHSWPIIVVDWESHLDVMPRHVDALHDTIMHELVHAIQEARSEGDDWADEHEAEEGWR